MLVLLPGSREQDKRHVVLSALVLSLFLLYSLAKVAWLTNAAHNMQQGVVAKERASWLQILLTLRGNEHTKVQLYH